jgi:hypothetical protein
METAYLKRDVAFIAAVAADHMRFTNQERYRRRDPSSSLELGFSYL